MKCECADEASIPPQNVTLLVQSLNGEWVGNSWQEYMFGKFSGCGHLKMVPTATKERFQSPNRMFRKSWQFWGR